MSHHITDGDGLAGATPAAPLACPLCGGTDLLYAVALAELLAATAPSSSSPIQGGWLRRDSEHWPEQGLIVCCSCVRVHLRFEQLVPAALPPSSADVRGEGS